MGNKILSKNKKAFHDYYIIEEFETGIELVGTEVKSLREGKSNLKDSYIGIKRGELYVSGMHISPYEKGNIFNRDPIRERKLLMHKKEIRKLNQRLKEDGLTIIPLEVYLKGKWVKLKIALVKGKKLYDKRESDAQRDAQRTMERMMKNG